MDQDRPPSGGRKVRFAPKAPVSTRKPKPPSVSKTEIGDDEAQAQNLLNRFNANVKRQAPKVEKKSSVQVAFGHGATSSTSIRTFGVRRDGDSGRTTDTRRKDVTSDDGQIIISAPSNVKEDKMDSFPSHAVDPSPLKGKKDYKEPWDYSHSYYPTTLPWRKPYSGNPELLDEAEFGEAARKFEYDEKTINAASDLGLLEESEKQKMFLFQLPSSLPLLKRSASAKGKEKAGSSISSARGDALKKGCSLEEFPEGYVGKIQVYKSGAVKLKIGDILYDVVPGSGCTFAQDAVAINTKDQQFCVLGELDKRIVVTPDVDSLLDSVVDLD